MPTAIRFEHVSKSFRLSTSRSIKDRLLGIAGHRVGSRVLQAVTDLDFEVQQGESVALLGHNGSGKSTSLKMLAGTVAPSAGRIWAAGRLAPLLELGAGFHPDLTGRENIFLNAAVLGIRREEVRRRLDDIVAFAEVGDFLETPVKFYSSGMVVRLGFAVAVNVDPDVLLVDELLAVGDESFQDKSLARMRQFRADGRTVVIVTHSLDQAVDFCDRALVLDHGVLSYDGPMGGAAEAYHRSSRASGAHVTP